MPSRQRAASMASISMTARSQSYVAMPRLMKALSQFHWCGYWTREGTVQVPASLARRTALAATSSRGSGIREANQQPRHVACGVLEVHEPNVFVRAVCQVAGTEPKSRGDHWNTPLREEVHRRCPPDKRGQKRGLAVDLLCGLRTQPNQKCVRIGHAGPLRSEDLDLDIGEAFRVEVPPQLLGDVARILVGHQAKVQLGRRHRRHDRLRSRALVAACQTGDVARRVERRGIDCDACSTQEQPLQSKRLLVLLLLAWQFLEQLLLPRRYRPYSVVEPRDQHSLVLVLQRVQSPGQPPGGVGQ